MSARLLDLSRAILTSGDLSPKPENQQGILCLALDDGTVVYVAKPNETLEYAESMQRFPAFVKSQHANAYIGSLIGSEDAIASTETRTGIIRTDQVPKVRIEGFEYFEFRLYGNWRPLSNTRTTISAFQLYGSSSYVEGEISQASLLYSMPTQKLNGVIDFWDKSIEGNLWDVVLLVPEFYIKGEPSLLYFSITLSHVQRDIHAALDKTVSHEPQISSIAANVTTGFKKVMEPHQNQVRSNTTHTKNHEAVVGPTHSIVRIDSDPDSRRPLSVLGSRQAESQFPRHSRYSTLEKDMNKFMEASKRFLRDESGVTAIEYGLIASLIVVGLAAAVTPVGTAIASAFTTIATELGVTP